jgi:hypothetical protein
MKLRSILSLFISKPVQCTELDREISHQDAHLLIADAKLYIGTGAITQKLQERIDLLMAQDNSIKTYEALEILLDYAERNLRK